MTEKRFCQETLTNKNVCEFFSFVRREEKRVESLDKTREDKARGNKNSKRERRLKFNPKPNNSLSLTINKQNTQKKNKNKKHTHHSHKERHKHAQPCTMFDFLLDISFNKSQHIGRQHLLLFALCLGHLLP